MHRWHTFYMAIALSLLVWPLPLPAYWYVGGDGVEGLANIAIHSFTTDQSDSYCSSSNIHAL